MTPATRTRAPGSALWVGASLILLATLFVPRVAVGQEGVLTLEEALRIARERFPALAAAKDEVRAAEGRVRSQGAFPNPHVEARAENGSAADQEDSIELRQEIEVFGQWLLRRRKAGWELAGKEQALQREVIDLTLRVKAAYFDLLGADTAAEVARENLSVADRLLKVARTRFEVGDAPRADWIKSEVEYTRAIQEVLRAERALAEKRAGLNFFLGRVLGTPLKLVEPQLPAREEDLARLQDTAAAVRPEIKAAGASLRAAESQVSLARSRWLPRLSIFARLERGRIAGAGWEYIVGPQISFPIFDFGSIGGEIEQARAAAEAGKANAELVRQQVALEVEAAYLLAREAERQVESFRTGILSQAEQVLKLTLTGYEQGARPFLDVLDAQRTFRATKLDHVLALRNYREALAQLDRAVGFSP